MFGGVDLYHSPQFNYVCWGICGSYKYARKQLSLNLTPHLQKSPSDCHVGVMSFSIFILFFNEPSADSLIEQEHFSAPLPPSLMNIEIFMLTVSKSD